MDRNDVVTLGGFQVVAIRGQGVWVADDSGNCWHVGGPKPGHQQDNKLAQAYRGAFPDE